jgi:hypothetical protein
MKKIRKAMYGVTRKGHLIKNIYGMYIMFDRRRDAENFAYPDGEVLKIAITIQPT